MEKPAAEDAVEELTEIPEDLQWIYETEGISVRRGSKIPAVYRIIFSLNLFLDTIDENAKVIRDAYESGNIKPVYHKGPFPEELRQDHRGMELSKLAESLEDAGNKGRTWIL